MQKSILTIICFIGISFCQIQHGGVPKFFNNRTLDINLISIDEERYKVPECLFNPSLLNMEETGIDKLVYDSISKCDIDLRRELFNNVVLSGGTTLFNNLDIRLKSELENIVPKSVNIKIISLNNRKY